MNLTDLPFWIRIILWVIRALAMAQPPKNGELKEENEV